MMGLRVLMAGEREQCLLDAAEKLASEEHEHCVAAFLIFATPKVGSKRLCLDIAAYASGGAEAPQMRAMAKTIAEGFAAIAAGLSEGEHDLSKH